MPRSATNDTRPQPKHGPQVRSSRRPQDPKRGPAHAHPLCRTRAVP
jgi:hypothetical protein